MLKKQISSSANVKKTPKSNHPISRIRIEPDKLSNTINPERKIFTANTEENVINEVDEVGNIDLNISYFNVILLERKKVSLYFKTYFVDFKGKI